MFPNKFKDWDCLQNMMITVMHGISKNHVFIVSLLEPNCMLFQEHHGAASYWQTNVCYSRLSKYWLDASHCSSWMLFLLLVYWPSSGTSCTPSGESLFCLMLVFHITYRSLQPQLRRRLQQREHKVQSLHGRSDNKRERQQVPKKSIPKKHGPKKA